MLPHATIRPDSATPKIALVTLPQPLFCIERVSTAVTTHSRGRVY